MVDAARKAFDEKADLSATALGVELPDQRTHVGVGLTQFALQFSDILDAKVKNGRSQRRISAASAKNLDKIPRGSRPSRCNHRNRNGLCHGPNQLAVESRLSPVAIH